MGVTVLLNSYVDPSIGKRKAERWFQPTGKNELDHFDKELPAEWECEYK